jgi:hypothetical protein
MYTEVQFNVNHLNEFQVSDNKTAKLRNEHYDKKISTFFHVIIDLKTQDSLCLRTQREFFCMNDLLILESIFLEVAGVNFTTLFSLLHFLSNAAYDLPVNSLSAVNTFLNRLTLLQLLRKQTISVLYSKLINFF